MQDFAIRYPLLLGSSCSNNNLAFIVPNHSENIFYENIISLQNVMELVIQNFTSSEKRNNYFTIVQFCISCIRSSFNFPNFSEKWLTKDPFVF